MDFVADKDPYGQIKQSYPIRSRVFGWHFRVEELPTGYWQAKGRDGHGQTVIHVGDNPEDVLQIAESEAIKLKDEFIAT